jgi:O-antigen/teichoic acid export membrane protein
MKRRVLHGVAWVGGLMSLARVIRYVGLLVLAGLLTPRDFGVFAALYVVIDGLALLQGFGIGHALICRTERVEESADTSFFLSLTIATCVFVLAWFGAPAISRFYDEASMVGLFRAGSAILLLRAFRMVPARLFEKALDFRKRLFPTLAGSLGFLVVAVVMAARGAGPWSLVVAEVASALLETAVYWIISPWRPRFRFRAELARQDLAFGWAVLGGSVLIFAFRNIDRVAVSRLISNDALGLYAFAYSIANLPATLFVRALNTVLLPSYSSVAGDASSQGGLFFRATTYVAAASLLYALGIAAFGGPLLHVLYDDKWAGSIGPLSVLVLFALFRSLAGLVGDLLVGTGEPGTYRRIHALQLAVAAGGLYFGAAWGGVTGVAVAMTLATLVLVAVSYRAASRILGAGPESFLRAFRAPVIATLIAAGPAYGLARLGPLMSGLAGIIASGVAVTAIFLTAWFAADGELRSEYSKWRAVMRRRRRGGTPP